MENEKSPTAAELAVELEIVDYVAGHLSGAELADFELRLAEDPQLRQQVEEERALSAAFDVADIAAIPPASAFEKIRPALATRAHAASLHWRQAAIAAGLVLAVSLVVLVPGRQVQEYEALSSDAATPLPDATRVRVIFSGDPDALQRQQLAGELGFEILSGPGIGGSYIVRPQPGQEAAKLRTWREHPAIQFAEPLHYDASP